MSLKAFPLATAAVVVLTFPALAQDKTGVNAGPRADGAAQGPVSTMALAQELYALGVAQDDAVTLLAAAKLAASIKGTMAEAGALDPAKAKIDGEAITLAKKAAPVAVATAPKRNGSTPRAVAKATFFTATNKEEGAAIAPVTADAMFAKARELAADDAALVGLIDDARAEAGRGRIGGAVEWPSRLPSGQTDLWEITYSGNTYAEITIIGDGDANLDVTVTDENGNVICSDMSWSDKLYCDWTPVWDGYFYVTVQNMGGSRNSYYLITN